MPMFGYSKMTDVNDQTFREEEKAQTHKKFQNKRVELKLRIES